MAAERTTAEGRAAYDAKHQPTADRVTTPLTFEQLASGDHKILGAARFRADHGDTATRDLLTQVHDAYRNLGNGNDAA